MATTFGYATAQQAAIAASEMIGRYRAGTLEDDVPLAVNQIYGILGFGVGLTFGHPGDPAPPPEPVPPEPTPIGFTFEEAEARIEQAKTGVITGSGSWLTVALRMALTQVISGANIPDAIKQQLLSLVEKLL